MSGRNIYEGFPRKLSFPLIKPKLSVALISTGYFHVIFSTIDNEIYGWGHNNFGQLGLGSTSEKEIIPRLVIN